MPHKQFHEAGMRMLIFQWRDLRLSEVERFACGSSADKSGSQDKSPVLTLQSRGLASFPPCPYN